MREFSLKILAADRLLYDGRAVYVNLPLEDGEMGVLAGHGSMISAVVPGVLSFRVQEDDRERDAAVSAGIVEITGSSVLVLVETAEYAEDIDINRAERAAKRAKEAMQTEKSRREYTAREFELARALGRLRAARKKYKL